MLCAVPSNSETCNFPSGPAGWVANTKTTAALPGPSLANTSEHTVQESCRPYTTWQTKQHWLLAMSYFGTSRPPANCGLSDTPLCYFSRYKAPHLAEEETDCAKPSHLRVLKCPLTHYVKSAFNTVAGLASIVASPSLPPVCSEHFL